ncbi:Sugar or nucleoside kinase, ribokinase family [Paramicrobacterium humi]|uniref:Sugar or nucleoside kinase, ribokinase family n=1 Tax=Paramicrobacterium humi TaxID=640635 RepID=A0A1H4T1D6_9MICO|nr:carbohydrate kinase family protein [Microbacterium humi]SEC50232.1 Sugar or nucleoside kinase, ribokinase family [Microbacterium humi]
MTQRNALPRVFVSGPVSWNHLVFLDALPEPSPHTVFAQADRFAIGGTSAGKAFNLTNLGAGVTLRTVLGDDADAAHLEQALRAAGIHLLAERADDGQTERHLNLMAPGGKRLSVYLHAAQFEPRDPSSDVLAALAASEVALIDLADHNRPLLRAARERGIPVWCDIHDWDGESEFHREFVDAADVLFMSADRHPDPIAFLTERVAAGARAAVCTDGARGAVAVDETGARHVVAAEPVGRVVDTNGAGDGFIAAFCVSYLSDGDVATALAAGARQGAAVVQSPELAPVMGS